MREKRKERTRKKGIRVAILIIILHVDSKKMNMIAIHTSQGYI